MPANPAAISAGVIALSVAVAAAIAIYESPELRRLADDLRRRIAVALHSLGDEITPPPGRDQNEPMFNRPEDAEGFMMSSRSAEVDADAESMRRQREELMYWNRLHLEKKERERREFQQQLHELNEKADESSPSYRRHRSSQRGSSFDDFLKPDESGEKGTFVVSTGADIIDHADEGLVRRRMPEGVRGLNASVYANPFADEHGIDMDDEGDYSTATSATMEKSAISPGHDEIMSDIYSYHSPAPEKRLPVPVQEVPVALPVVAAGAAAGAAVASVAEVLFDAAEDAAATEATEAVTANETPKPQDESGPDNNESSSRLPERELGQDEYMTAGQEAEGEDQSHHEAYASIQAWAQNSSGFYSPLPVSPPAPLSEPEIISDGELTPTDSASLAGSGEDVGADMDAASERTGTEGRRYLDVMSEDEDAGMLTPASWTEVGSVVSESDAGAH